MYTHPISTQINITHIHTCYKNTPNEHYCLNSPSDALHSVINGEDMHPLPILDVWVCCDAGRARNEEIFQQNGSSNLTISPRRQCRFRRTTLFILIFSLATASPDKTMHTYEGVRDKKMTSPQTTATHFPLHSPPHHKKTAFQ